MPSAAWTYSLQGFVVEETAQTECAIEIKARRTVPVATCPTCQQSSRRVHSYYSRTLKSLPLEGHSVVLRLTVRRFRCLNAECPRATFSEALPHIAAKHAQRTDPFTQSVQAIGLATSGEAGQRLAGRLALPVSADTLLRIIRATTLTAANTSLQIIGVDDWALRRSHVYGTLLVDLEQHRPIDLLADRTAETLAAWLKAHPGISLVTRDRATEYIRGISLGAPAAKQVADRWHLLKNLQEVLERLVARLQASLRQLPLLRMDAPAPAPRRPAWTSAEAKTARQARRASRLARFEQVRALHQQGLTIRRIASTLQMSRVTVRAYSKAETFPEMAPRPRASQMDRYLPCLQASWRQGCRNAAQLWREICLQGFTGTRRQVDKWVSVRREEPRRYSKMKGRPPSPPTVTPAHAPTPLVADQLPSPRKLSWVMLKIKHTLDVSEMAVLQRVRQHPDVELSYGLVQQFAHMIRQHSDQHFETWLCTCEQSSVPELVTFATGLRSDFAAIQAALSEPWSNGQLEGQVNRLKLIKRQMYGRAKFDLLRIRVLAPS